MSSPQKIYQESVSASANKLVRLAISAQSGEKLLRREDIVELVLGGSATSFRQVLAEANHQLDTIFGLELVSLPTAAKTHSTETAAGRKAAVSASTTIKQSNAYVLRRIIGSESPVNTCMEIDSCKHFESGYFHKNSHLLALLMCCQCLLALADCASLPGSQLVEQISLLGANELLAASGSTLNMWIWEMRRQRYFQTTRLSLSDASSVTNDANEENASVMVNLRGSSGEDDPALYRFSQGPRALIEMPRETLVAFINRLASEAPPGVIGEPINTFKKRIRRSMRAESQPSEKLDTTFTQHTKSTTN